MQTDEVKAAACVLKEPFLTFESILGLVGPGSRAFILHAIHPAEKGKRCVCRGQCKQSHMKKVNIMASRTKMTHQEGSSGEILQESFRSTFFFTRVARKWFSQVLKALRLNTEGWVWGVSSNHACSMLL